MKTQQRASARAISLNAFLLNIINLNKLPFFKIFPYRGNGAEDAGEYTYAYEYRRKVGSVIYKGNKFDINNDVTM